MTKPQILKVRKYIHDKYHVFFACVRGELLYSQQVLDESQVDDVLKAFSNLECFTSSVDQQFFFRYPYETSTNII